MVEVLHNLAVGVVLLAMVGFIKDKQTDFGDLQITRARA